MPCAGPMLSRASLVAQTVKLSAYNVGDLGSIPGSGRSPGEGNGILGLMLCCCGLKFFNNLGVQDSVFAFFTGPRNYGANPAGRVVAVVV